MNKNNSYHYLVDSEIKKVCSVLSETFKNNIDCDLATLEECEQRIFCYLEKISEPSEYKIAGTLIFWVRKLKPFSFEKQLNKEQWLNPFLFLNEYIAVLYGYMILHHLRIQNSKENKSPNSRFIKDLVVQLRYSSFSPSSLEMLVASQY